MASGTGARSGNDIMISLLGRIAFPEDKLRDLITRGKRNPDAYVRGYNACDGAHTVSEIAKVVGVTPGTLVPILQQWERSGVIFSVEKGERGKYYKRIYSL